MVSHASNIIKMILVIFQAPTVWLRAEPKGSKKGAHIYIYTYTRTLF